MSASRKYFLFCLDFYKASCLHPPKELKDLNDPRTSVICRESILTREETWTSPNPNPEPWTLTQEWSPWVRNPVLACGLDASVTTSFPGSLSFLPLPSRSWVRETQDCRDPGNEVASGLPKVRFTGCSQKATLSSNTTKPPGELFVLRHLVSRSQITERVLRSTGSLRLRDLLNLFLRVLFALAISSFCFPDKTFHHWCPQQNSSHGGRSARWGDQWRWKRNGSSGQKTERT